MAKRKNDPSPGNDYLEQLEWQSRHSRPSLSVHYEPKWKYKIIRRTPPTTPFDKIGRAILILASFGTVLFVFLSDGVTSGEKIFFGVIFGLIVVILFFALRDGAKGNDENSDEQNDESGQ